MNDNKFYLQDKRQYVGNCILFWSIGGGYTTNVKKAEKFSKEAAFKQHKCRPDIDIPIPCEYIDKRTMITVDCQYVRVKEALDELGLELIQIPKPKKRLLNCHGCGRFLSEHDYYCGCVHCGASNRP